MLIRRREVRRSFGHERPGATGPNAAADGLAKRPLRHRFGFPGCGAAEIS